MSLSEAPENGLARAPQPGPEAGGGAEPVTGGGALGVAGVAQHFGKTIALQEINLEVAAGEFVGLLGPSGCGKSTLLRIIAGFNRPTRGTVTLDGTDITKTPAEKRPINMVFQRPTLFPHLDVFDNVAFGLRVTRTDKASLRQRVGEALDLVRLGHLARRRAYELSGGQMQRIALARALVNRPRVLLLDEPLSALDLKIRLEMEAELRRLHVETGSTFVYVTHDQGEAMSMSDRVAVFSEGAIAQMGTPNEIYTAPDSFYVARFVGDANVIPVAVLDVGAGSARISVAGTQNEVPAAAVAAAGPAQLVLRAESIRLAQPGDGLPGRVIDKAFRGVRSSYLIDVEGLERPLRAEVPSSPSGGEPDVGDAVGVGWTPGAARLLRPESEPSPEEEIAA